MNLKPIIISAPFGNYFSYPGSTSTLGTFTCDPRGGAWYRLWRCIRTLRPLYRAGGWINKLGLPNPGVEACPRNCDDVIVSIHGFNEHDWTRLSFRMAGGDCFGEFFRPYVELNLSCPNVENIHSIANLMPAIANLFDARVTVIAKLPPVRWMELAEPLYDLGVRHFHCCNTIPTPGGGISGKPVKQYSLWATEQITQKWSDAVVIAGGGVTSLRDVCDYVEAGAQHVAIGSALLNPLRWRTVRRLTQCKFDLQNRRVYFES